MSSKRLRRKYRGFTLIELLVAVAIIALLIALLLPSLERARIQSRTVVCSSNQRSITQATLVFAQEREGYVPGSGYAYSAWNFGGTGIGQGIPFGNSDTAVRSSALIRTGYVGSWKTFLCPETARSNTWMGTRAFLHFSNVIGYGYGFNGALAATDHAMQDDTGTLIWGVQTGQSGIYPNPSIMPDFAAYKTPTASAAPRPLRINDVASQQMTVWVADCVLDNDVIGKGSGGGFSATGTIVSGATHTYNHSPVNYTAPAAPANGDFNGYNSSVAANAAHGDHTKVSACYLDGHVELRLGYFVDPTFGAGAQGPANPSATWPYQCFIPSNSIP